MNGYSGGPPPMPAGVEHVVEAGVAILVMLFILGSSLATLNEQYRDAEAWHVHLGAAIYGAVFGVVIGFIIMPLRFLLSGGNVDPQTASWASMVFLVVMIALRRGLIGQLPFLGPQVKAYRRASLRRSIERSQKQLAKLTAKTPAPIEGGG
jgi:hypothetical protein